MSKKKKKPELKIKMVNTQNDRKLKSTELFMIKRDIEEIASLIKEKGHMIPSSVQSIAYISEQIDKITGEIRNIFAAVKN